MLQQSLSLFVNGISIGIAFFLAAAGLTILFGILRILNFAHGSFIMIGAYLASTLLRHAGKYGALEFFLVALLVGAIVGVIGLLVDRFVFRRLHGVDESVALIATFALMLVINGACTLAWGANFLSVDPPEGLGGAISVGPIMFPAFSVFLLAVGVLLFLLLDVFLQRSWLGKTLLAVAEDRWIMAILGHSPRKLELLAVFLAFFLAGFAGSLLVPNQILAPSLGNQMIIQAFAVVIVGGLGSIRGTFIAALLLGLAESVGSLVMPSLSLYLCMIFILIFRPQGLIAPRHSLPPGSWSLSWLWSRRSPQAIAPRAAARTAAGAVAIPSAKRTPTWQVGVFAALAIATVVLPLWAGGGVLYIACLVLIGTVFAMSWNLMFGFGGVATFGHAAFFAVGAYLSAYALKSASAPPFGLVLAGAAVLAAIIAATIGIVAIRRANGVQLAILTLALAEVLRVIISYTAILGRDEGLSAVPRPRIGFGGFSTQLASDASYYLFLCLCCGLLGAFLWALCHSAFGRTLRSIRQDAQRALFLGINVDRFRLLAFIVAAAVAAVCGALSAPLSQIVTPETASIARSTQPMLHTLVGGMASFWGPAVGTLVFAAIEYATRTLAGLSELIMGITLLAIVLVAPGGVVGWARTLYGRLAQRKRPAAADIIEGSNP